MQQQFTKRAIEESLKHLLLKKPLNKITINDITDNCGISRMTFYYHFKDIYDLVDWALIEDAKIALEGKKTYDTWQQGLVQIFFFVKNNRPFVQNVFRCIGSEKVEIYLRPLTDNLLIGVLNELSSEMTVREEDKAFIARVYSYSFIGLVLDWVRADMKEDPEILVERFENVIHGDMHAALERFRTDRRRTGMN